MPESVTRKRKAQSQFSKDSDIRKLFVPSSPSCGPTVKLYQSPVAKDNTMLQDQTRQVIDLTSTPPNVVNRSIKLQALNRGGPRKLAIKNLRPVASENAPAEYFAQVRDKLDRALTVIFTEKATPLGLEELYRGVENICRAGKAPELYADLRSKCERYIQDGLQPDLLGKRTSEKNMVLEMQVVWDKWCQQLGVVRSIYFFLERSYLLGASMPSVWDMGLEIFRTHVVSQPSLSQAYFSGVAAMFESDRNGDRSWTGRLLASIRMISSLSLYSTNFQPTFLESTKLYYESIAIQLEQVHVAEYLGLCASRLEDERERCERFGLEQRTLRSAIEIVDKVLIEQQARTVVERGVVELIEGQDIPSLHLLYTLLQRVGLTKILLDPWSNYIRQSGSEAVMDSTQDSTMVNRLMSFKDKMDAIVEKSFEGDDDLANSLRESFAWFVNRRQNTPAEMTAKYLDGLLRSGNKKLEEADQERVMDKLLAIFRFIHGKDTFEAFYKKDLAKRLLLNKSASADAERSMLTRLKTECGPMFTQKLEGMFNDVDISKDFMSSFKQTKHSSEGIDLYANVLSQAFWPNFPEAQVVMPEAMSRQLEYFRSFYLTKQSGRRLMWRHGLGHCVLKAKFNKGAKELTMSLFQAVVILLFNENKVLSVDQIRQGSGLEDRELLRTLQSLACGKVRVLQKTPRGREVAKNDEFCVNEDFTNEAYRVKINQIQIRETREEKEETHERVKQDRQFEIQAAIIRILKSRKQMKHVELVQATIEQTKNRGTLDLADIKTQVERLIDKDYMERVDKDTYIYVA